MRSIFYKLILNHFVFYVFFVFYRFDADDHWGLSFGLTFGVAAGVAIIVYFAFIHSGVVERYVERNISTNADGPAPNVKGDLDAIPMESPKTEEEEVPIKIEHKKTEHEDVETGSSASKSRMQRAREVTMHGVNVDIHDDLGQLELDIHKNAEKFDPKTEKAFAWLQVDIYVHICTYTWTHNLYLNHF